MLQVNIQLEIANRLVEYKQLSDFSWEFVFNYFTEWDVEDKIFMIFDGDDYLFSVEDYHFRTWSCPADMQFFMCYELNNVWLDSEHEIAQAQKLFMERPYIEQIPIGKPKWKAGTDWKFFDSRDHSRYNVNELVYEYIRVSNELRLNGVNSFCVRIPNRKDLIRDEEHEKWRYSFSMKKMWKNSVKERASRALPHLTDMKYDEIKRGFESETIDKKTFGDGKRKIYLVGPCIVTGEVQLKGESLPCMLSSCLKKCGIRYEIICVRMNTTKENVFKKILEYDIYANDIIIFLERFKEGYDLDLTKFYQRCSGEKWLYQDTPIHTTKYGNEMIAKVLVEHIVRHIWEKAISENDEKILCYGVPQLSYITEQKIDQYTRSVNCGKDNAGAIVVNCNPFTLGHRYLIEYALSRSAFLYVFVVEEDLSVFSFEDRYKLVKEGTKDLERIQVVPSGKFIISKDTFRSYFKKETEQKEVDVTRDVWIFAQYIAPRLNITKRFVGEEPNDYVTNQYNQEMKKVFPLYGIELEEIPRKQIGNKIISAKYVRNRYKEGDWKELKSLVPGSTFDFLRQYHGLLQKKGGTKVSYHYGKDVKQKVSNFIHCHKQIILYGIGKDATAIYDSLEAHDRDMIEFCDQKANDNEIFFFGKKVIAPNLLKEQYENYYILISSSLYARQIFDGLLQFGIDVSHIYANTLAAEFWRIRENGS
ncbi:MAG: hypothetical protein NC180_06725 [Muribaculaceae bacterium]|nr:hypothetical protein [Roseburia sp.]MCM1429847.1 hypothetical protein [Muribaculaceae bacterium]MCM1492898.1 hypothetical protein [Muribaculaceae bacterium]